MADSDGETLESWLNKATNPCNRQEDWEYIISFCDQVNKELEGPQIAVRLLAHKIQSPQEWEALQALTVLEASMKNCGRRFHSEVGKFRFLNELIKVVSPKYLGDRISEKVKSKVIGLLYSWTVALPEETKIKEAYHMLKRQGIILADPEIPVDHTLVPSPPTRPKNPIFDDEERSKILARLLKSKNPDDLQEANKLIKSMVKEDEVRMQRASKRTHTLEEVSNNVMLLQEMLTHYSKDDSSDGDKELMKELYERCEMKRLALFKMASETEDNDSALGDILQASDDLSRVINMYRKAVEGQDINGDISLPDTHSKKGSLLVASSYFRMVRTALDIFCFIVNRCPFVFSINFKKNVFFPSSSASIQVRPQLPMGVMHVSAQFPLPVAPGSPLFLPLQQGSPQKGSDISLSAVNVPLGTIKPSSLLPVTAYDKNGFRVLLHFAKECPPGRPDVLVVVVSMLNTAPMPVQNIQLQAAVPKTMKVKLQPPSGTDLSPFNPIQPPAAITQVMLLANPLKEKVRLRFKLSFVLGEEPSTEVGEVDQFPEPDLWGIL
uniref:Golgi-associated, gamma adaptin ear containing, ARF binding protein 3 n=1 Tax=Xenopus tropicalis TaxID=8364 RepID=A0A6I8RJJ0_XENTR